MVYKDTSLRIRLTDTCGQERFKCLTSSLYRNSSAYVFVYDLSRPNTFKDMSEFVSEANKYNPDAAKIVVGCKTDLIDSIENIEMELGINEWLFKNNIAKHFFVSNKTGENVEELKQHLISVLFEQM